MCVWYASPTTKAWSGRAFEATRDIQCCLRERRATKNSFRRYTSDDGIDLTYNGNVLNVCVRYSKYVFNRNTLQDCPLSLLADVITFGRNNNIAIDEGPDGLMGEESVEVGTTFEDVLRQLVVTIVEVNLPAIRCKIVQPSSRRNEYITYDNAGEVRDMIREYN